MSMTDTTRPVGIRPLAWVVVVLIVPLLMSGVGIAIRLLDGYEGFVFLALYQWTSLLIALLAWLAASYVNQRTHSMKWWHHLELLVVPYAIAFGWFWWVVAHLTF